MIRTPPQHNLEHPPGQIVHTPALTVNDQISRMMKDEPKKLSFEEWWHTAGGLDLNCVKRGDQWYGPFIDKSTFQLVWEVAQANK